MLVIDLYGCELVWVAEDRGKRLFTKNTGPCEDGKSMYTD